MKILIINEPFIKDFCRTQRWAARSRGRSLRAPDWLGYATSVLEREKKDVELYDFVARDWDKDKLRELVREKKAGLVVLDSTTPSIFSDIECAKICKEEGAFVLMVGPHASALPEETLKEGKGAIGAIAKGEYDYTVLDVVNHLEKELSLDEVPGISFLRPDGSIKNNPSRPLIENLDELPYPAYHWLNLWDYFEGGKRYPFLTIIGGRGCPFRCTFCLWPQVMHGRKYRMRSPENIVSEMEYWLKKWPELKKGEFFFEDDTFTVSVPRAKEICELIIKRLPGITFTINARADIIDREMFRLMKRAGLRTIWLGVETGEQEILNNVKKGIKVSQTVEFVKEVHRAGLQVHGCFVFGLPGETKETIEKTLKFAKELKLDTLQFSASVPFPGTEYFDYCRKNNLIKAKSWADWLSGGEQGTVVEYPGLTKEYIESAVDRGLKSFYYNPLFLIKFIFESRNLNDLYRKVRGGLNYTGYLLKKIFSR